MILNVEKKFNFIKNSTIQWMIYVEFCLKIGLISLTILPETYSSPIFPLPN